MDKDRVIALGTVGILAGTIAVIFSTRTGTAATVLTWGFAGSAIAAFIALPWPWYQRAFSWLRSGVIARMMPRRLRRRRDRAQLMAAARWRFTTDGLEVPQARRDVDRNIDHPSYMRPADSVPPCVRVIALVPCAPLGGTPDSQELRDRFLAWLAQTSAMALIGDLCPGQQDVTWKSWATPRRSNLRADLTGEDQAQVPLASAVLELPSDGVRLAGTDPRYAELILHVDLPATDFARGLPDWRRRLTEAVSMPGELARFLQEVGLTLPAEPSAQVGVLLRGRQSLTEIVSPGSIPLLPASSAQIVSEFIGLAIAVPDGRTAEETASLMVLDLSERDLHLNGTQAEMSGEISPVAGPAEVPSGPAAADEVRLLAVGSAGNLPRLSQLSDDVLGATPTRYTMAGDAPYVPRPGHDAAIRALLAATRPPYPFVVVWGDTKSGKSRTVAEALRAVFVRESGDPVVVLPKDGAALAELSRIGLPVPDDGAPAIVLLDDLAPADLEALTPDVLDQVTSWAVIAATMTARQRNDVLRSGSEVGTFARSALEHRSRQYELPSDPPAGAAKADAERLYPGERFDGSIAETLVGGRELIARYKASHDENPAGCAVLRAAIDCRRAGLSRPVTEPELLRLFPSYLRAIRVDLAATGDLFADGIRWAEVPVASQVALLRRTDSGREPATWTVLDHAVTADDGDGDQSSRPIPADTWAEVIAMISPEDALGVGFAAYARYAVSVAMSAFRKGSASADADLAQAATFSLGFLLDEHGDPGGARAAYQHVADSGHPEYAPAAAVNLGALLARQGDFAGARAAYAQAIATGHPDQVSMAEINQGLLLTDQGDTGEARAAFLRAIDSAHPDNAPAAAVNLGNLLTGMGETEAARDAYQRAIDSGHPDHSVAAEAGLGNLLAEQGDVAGARDAFQHVIDSGHADYGPTAETNLGFVLARQGDNDGARSAYQHVIDSAHPRHVPSASFNLGNLLTGLGETEAARDAYQRAIDSGHPDHAPAAAVNLGNLLKQQGDPDGARAAFQLAIHSGNPVQAAMAQVQLANLLLQQGDTDGARAAYQSVIEDGPARPAAAAALNLAMLLIAGHEFDAARHALTLAINSGEADISGEAQRLLDSLSGGHDESA